MTPALQCKGRTWGKDPHRCAKNTRRRDPLYPNIPMCWTHGGVWPEELPVCGTCTRMEAEHDSADHLFIPKETK